MCNEHGIFCNVSSMHVHQIINALPPATRVQSPQPQAQGRHSPPLPSHAQRGVRCLQTHAEDPQACRSVFIHEQTHINIAQGDRPRPTSDIRAGWPQAPQTQAPPRGPSEKFTGMVLEGPVLLPLWLQFSSQHRHLPKCSRGAPKQRSILLS